MPAVEAVEAGETLNWSARLEFSPIVTPDGKTLHTLDDARRYLIDHPCEEAAGALLRAAEQPNQFYLLCARIAVYRAIYGHGETSPKPPKNTWRDKRKARQR